MLTTTSVSELKARLSAYLELVRQGDEVMVTDRGRPVALITPVTGAAAVDVRRDELLRTGRMTPPRVALTAEFAHRRLPADRAGRSLAALLEDRESGA